MRKRSKYRLIVRRYTTGMWIATVYRNKKSNKRALIEISRLRGDKALEDGLRLLRQAYWGMYE